MSQGSWKDIPEIGKLFFFFFFWIVQRFLSVTCFLKEIVFILMISGSAQLGFSFSLHGFDMIEEEGGGGGSRAGLESPRGLHTDA